MKKHLFLLAFLFALHVHAQRPNLLETQWIGTWNTGIRFSGDTVQSNKFNFFSTYSVSGNQLTIHHDYSDMDCTTDSAGVEIPCPDWKLPDAVFRICRMSKKELLLYPLNASAMQITDEANNKGITIHRYSDYAAFLEKQRLERVAESEQAKEDGTVPRCPPVVMTACFEMSTPQVLMGTVAEVDTLRLRSAESFYALHSFDSITVSYMSTDWWGRSCYYDFELQPDGTFYSARNFSEKKGHDPGTFRGRLDQNTLLALNAKLSASGVDDPLVTEATNGMLFWSSHGLNLYFEVWYDGKSYTYNGDSRSAHVLLQPLVDAVLALEETATAERTKEKHVFQSSLYRPKKRAL